MNAQTKVSKGIQVLARGNEIICRLMFGTKKEKNWTPFMYNSSPYFLHSLNPTIILRRNEKPKLYNNNYSCSMEIIHQHKQVNISWNGKLFDDELRGGTPALFLKNKNVLLTFFHTKKTFVDGVSNYFMGAAIFNASPPFNLLNTTSGPIFDSMWYRKQMWVHSKMALVVYPTGLFASMDEKQVYISAGYQDRHTLVIEIDVEFLFKLLNL